MLTKSEGASSTFNEALDEIPVRLILIAFISARPEIFVIDF